MRTTLAIQDGDSVKTGVPCLPEKTNTPRSWGVESDYHHDAIELVADVKADQSRNGGSCARGPTMR